MSSCRSKSVYKWYLPVFSEILNLSGADRDWEAARVPSSPQSLAQQRLNAEREWGAAVKALNQLLQQMLSEPTVWNGAASETTHSLQGVLLSGPFPVLERTDWEDTVATWIFTVGSTGEVLQLPAAGNTTAFPWQSIPTLPLLSKDPLAAEPFCLTLTSEFSLVMTLGETSTGAPAFLYSFEPEVAWQAWRSLQARIKLAAPHLLPSVEAAVASFQPVVPDYRLVTQFSRLMLSALSQPLEWEGKRSAEPDSEPLPASVDQGATTWQKVKSTASKGRSGAPSSASESRSEMHGETSSDTELLQALAHEVRTPLTTIRTLTRLLLKRKDLNPDVIKRLEVIDRECTEQIDRFSLIFRAAELETAPTKHPLMSLAPISLVQVIQQNLARWQQQASQYSHTLDILLPQKLPMIVTDPTMLDQVLTGLIDRITHRLPPGSHIQVKVTPAGHQLKLQFESRPQPNASGKEGKVKMGFAPAVKSIGQLLMFQPETGNLSLNMAVTKNLFQALGGKLIVREHPQEGETLTIFLPLESRKSEE